MFDPVDNQPYKNFNLTNVNSPAHQQLAYQAAAEGVVLLKNTGVLPLNQASVSSIAVVGPNANCPATLQGNYYGSAPYLITPLNGISNYNLPTNYVFGCAINSQDTSGFAAACSAIQKSTYGVVVVGLNQSIESEGNDRVEISFPGVQEQFISAMSNCSSNPIIVVVMCGGMVDLTNVKANPNVGAIMWVGYPGQSAGTALADVIFGAYSPAGRLENTWYTANYINEVSMFDMGMRPNASNGNPGRTYRFFTGQPVYEFGYGLSYTTFNYTVTNNSLSSVSALKIDQELKEKKKSLPYGSIG